MKLQKDRANENDKTLEEVFPSIYQDLLKISKKLEMHYKDVQDIEFTIEREQLYLLQTRSAKRSATAAIKIAVDLHREGLLTKEEAILQVPADSINQLLHPQLDLSCESIQESIALGLAASPGACSGEVVLTAERAQKFGDAGKKVILVRNETSPGRHWRYGCFSGHSDCMWRHDISCCCSCKRNGKTMHCWHAGSLYQ